MIKEIIIFYKTAPSLVKQDFQEETLGKFLDKSKLSNYFVKYHIIPMVAAIWSMPFEKAKDMPLQLFLNFFNNHGLFKLKNRPQWYTVTNRSRNYVKEVLKSVSGEVFKNYKVSKVIRNNENIRILIDKKYLDYDHVILASHADQSLNLIESPTNDEKNILGKFTYISNLAFLHTDQNFMPKRKQAWSSWNSITDMKKTCVTYWLNKLQNLKSDKNYFLTLNPIEEIRSKHIIKTIEFTHPYFNYENTSIQKKLKNLQGKKKTWFCGSYFGYGFHEDGLKSSLNLIKNFEL